MGSYTLRVKGSLGCKPGHALPENWAQGLPALYAVPTLLALQEIVVVKYRSNGNNNTRNHGDGLYVIRARLVLLIVLALMDCQSQTGACRSNRQCHEHHTASVATPRIHNCSHVQLHVCKPASCTGLLLNQCRGSA